MATIFVDVCFRW